MAVLGLLQRQALPIPFGALLGPELVHERPQLRPGVVLRTRFGFGRTLCGNSLGGLRFPSFGLDGLLALLLHLFVSHCSLLWLNESVRQLAFETFDGGIE